MGSKSVAAAPSRALIKALCLQLESSLLPGDTPPDRRALEDAAAWLLSAAATRAPGQGLVHVESAAGERRHLRIAVVNDDMPFLVDSVAATIAAQGVGIDLLLHPVVAVERETSGAMIGLGTDGRRESLIYIETPRVDARQRRELLEALQITLGDVHAAVHDWPEMQAAMRADAADTAAREPEAGALLDWLGAGMLTQLGHLTRHRDGSTSARLGICTASASDLLADISYERAFAWFDRNAADGTPRALLAIKSNVQSRVHRASPLDLFIVPVHGDAGVVALSIHAGLWTSAALNERPPEVPVLRAMVDDMTARLGFDPGVTTARRWCTPSPRCPTICSWPSSPIGSPISSSPRWR